MMKLDIDDLAGELVDWWKAEPWRCRPFFMDGWNYQELYRSYREGWEIGRGRVLPSSKLRSAWMALCFPHSHSSEDFTDDEQGDVSPPLMTDLDVPSEATESTAKALRSND